MVCQCTFGNTGKCREEWEERMEDRDVSKREMKRGGRWRGEAGG